jgi:hypothetical protein
MSSNNRRVIFNTRERLLSTDLNDATALLHAKGTDEMVAALSGDSYKTVTPIAGVLSGGIASANGADLNITITPMIAVKDGTPATSLDSQYLKIETTTNTTIDLGPFVDPANPRWVAIEVAPADTDEVVSSRDIFQGALGTFTPANVSKIRRPEPTFTVNAGTAAPAPQLPAGTTGVIPLAYVYIPAATASIATTDVILCRPIFNAATTEGTIVFNKGGLDVAAAGGTVAQARPYAIKFNGKGKALGLPLAINVDAALAGNPNWVSGETYPAGEAAIYAYLAYPPFPAGYDADVASNREFLDLSTRIPSNTVAGVANGILVWSTVAPSLLGDPIGIRPGGAFAVNDATWNGGTTASHSYLGSVSAQLVAPAGLALQRTDGDVVRLNEPSKMPIDSQILQNVAAVLPPAVPGQFRNRAPMLLAGVNPAATDIIPAAQDYYVAITVDDTAGATNWRFTMLGDGEPLTFGGTQGTFNANAVANQDASTRVAQWFRTQNPGVFTFNTSEGGNTGNIAVRIHVLGYRDPFISQR